MLSNRIIYYLSFDEIPWGCFALQSLNRTETQVTPHISENRAWFAWLMVLLHVIRSARSVLYGWRCPPKNIFDETVVRLYAGWRMVDGFGHINNSRYLELFELARWNEAGQKRSISKFRKAGMYPVIAAAHIQFLREVPPARIVTIKTRIVSAEAKSFVVRQHMFNENGTTLHATALFRLSLIDSRRSQGEQKKTSQQASNAETSSEGTPAKTAAGASAKVLSADTAIERLGFDPAVVKQQLRDAWLADLGGADAASSSTDKSSGVTDTNDTAASSSGSITEAALKVLEDVNDLDDKWRRVVRQIQLVHKKESKQSKQK